MYKKLNGNKRNYCTLNVLLVERKGKFFCNVLLKKLRENSDILHGVV